MTTTSAIRHLATATVRFGGAEVAVRVYATRVTAARTTLRMLHSECQTPLERRFACPTCERNVQPGEIVKGYEYAKGRFVVIPPVDVEVEQPDRDMEVVACPSVGVVDPIYYGRGFHLAPERGAERAYALLVKALRLTKREAIARCGRGYALLRVVGRRLVLHAIVDTEEVRAADAIDVDPAIPVSGEEMAHAIAWVGRMAVPVFDRATYADERAKRLRQQVEERMTTMGQTKVWP